MPHPDVMLNFLRRGDPEQIRRSWYIFFFQTPWLPEYFMHKNDWRNSVRTLLGSSKKGSFRKADILEYKNAWSQPGAMIAMINWYRAAMWHRPKPPKDARVKVPTQMIWGMQDSALSHRMARLSIDYCDEGSLVLFEEATHWV